MNRRFSLILVALGLMLSACSEAPKPAAEKKEPPKPAEPVDGRFAFYQMYPTARAWAGDIEPLKLVSMNLEEIKLVPGKAPIWIATFVSPSKGRSRQYSYSIIEAGGSFHKGVFAGKEETFVQATSPTRPFNIAGIKTDSEEAYKAALEKAAEYEKKNPGKPITFLLENNKRFPQPTWRVIWGESVGTSNFSIFVDSVTGKYQQTMR